MAAVSAAIAVGIFLLDLVTKRLIMGWEVLPTPYDSYEVIPGFFSLVNWRNRGAAWGILQNRMPLLALLSASVFLAVVYAYRQVVDGWPERSVALGLFLGGIAGNLVDRLCYDGVVDFLLFYVRDLQWPAFNVADSAICVGLGLYLVSSFLRPEPVPIETATAAPPPSS